MRGDDSAFRRGRGDVAGLVAEAGAPALAGAEAVVAARDARAESAARDAVGSCFQRIHAFPSSGHLVDGRGRLVYLGATDRGGPRGIHVLAP